MSKLVCQNEAETRIFKLLARRIEDEETKENVYFIFDVLSGAKAVHDAHHPLDQNVFSELGTEISNHAWTKLRHWSKWWCRTNHLAMFTRAFKEMTDKDWEQGPSTTNPVEALNRQSLQEGCTILQTLLENIYLEDRLQAVKMVASKGNITTSYKASPRKRKRTSLGKSLDEGPPDKRQHVFGVRKASGRSVINRLVVEKDRTGKVTKYWGWCKGQIVAYRRNAGYLVKFKDIIDTNGTVIEGWSDWIEDLNSDDVRLFVK